MRFMEIANPEDQLALWRLISDNVWSAVMAQAKQAAVEKAQAAATSKQKKFKPKKPYLNHLQPQSPSHQPPSHPQRKVQYHHRLDRWPPAGLHHCPAPSQCSDRLSRVVLAKLICMACSSRLRVQVNPIRYKDPSRGSKPWGFGMNYCVF